MFFNLCSRELMDPEHRFTYPDGINGSMEINIDFSSPEEVDREMLDIYKMELARFKSKG